MKKMKLTKIFVLILSLALLIGSAVCVAASAGDDGEYTIKSVNIAHGDKIRVLIAVDAPIDAAEDITVNYTLNGESHTATYWKNVAIYAESGDDTLYPVYYTVGIAAKDMGEDVIAWIGDSAVTRNISVASYLYQRLYKDGIISATEGKDLNKKNFYVDMLEYGAKAQTVLWNALAENADSQRPLVTEYGWYLVEGGVYNGENFGIIKETGSAVSATLAYTGSDANFVGWKITSGDKISYVYDDITTYVATDGFVATPVASTSFVNFEGLAAGTGIQFVGDDSKADGNGLYPKDAVEAVTSGSLPTMTFAYHANSAKAMSAGSKVVVEEASGNKYLHYVHKNYKEVSTVDGRGLALKVNGSTEPKVNDTITVIEFDVNLVSAGCSADRCFNFNAYNESEGSVISLLGYCSGGYWQLRHTIEVADNVDPNATKVNVYHKIATVNTWTKIRMVYNSETKILYTYANGTLVSTIDNSKSVKAMDGNIDYVLFNSDAAYNGEAYLDNISISYTDKLAVACDFESYTVEEIKKTYESVDYFSNKYTFSGGVYVENTASTYLCEQDVRMITEENGNTYINVYSDRRQHEKDRGCSLYIKSDGVTPKNENADVLVYEFDFKLDSTVTLNDGSHPKNASNPLQWAFSGTGLTGGKSAVVRYTSWAIKNGNYVTGSGKAIAKVDEWVTLRFVYFSAEDTGTNAVIQIFAKARGAEEFEHMDTITVSDTLKNDSVGTLDDLDSIRYICITGLNSSSGVGEGFSYCLDNTAVYYADIDYVAYE